VKTAEYMEIPPRGSLSKAEELVLAVKASVLTPVYWALAHGLETPGLQVQARSFAMALRTLLTPRASLPLREICRMMAFPLDSVRYFELDFMWRSLVDRPFVRYLDVSSPRLFPILLLAARPELRADLLNPDGHDLETTRRLARAAGLGDACRLHGETIAAVTLEAGTFEVITSISVIEHIPEDAQAVGKMWSLLSPGGRLLLSVPCAAEEYEEYVSRNRYGVLEPQANGFTFWQRLYDQRLLEERIFAVTGSPVNSALFGEKVAGDYYRNARQKMSDPRYPVWREPYMVGQEYGRFANVADLPGVGVIALEFVKA
jgi:SAM-dependent methyltransferase